MRIIANNANIEIFKKLLAKNKLVEKVPLNSISVLEKGYILRWFSTFCNYSLYYKNTVGVGWEYTVEEIENITPEEMYFNTLNWKYGEKRL